MPNADANVTASSPSSNDERPEGGLPGQLYMRGLRRLKSAVLCVGEEGQKTYFDPVARRTVGYASGQQVKRSIIGALLARLGEERARVTFRLEEEKGGAVRSREAFSDCDPRYPDLLVGGWMRAEAGRSVITRRSPLSVSAMTPLHGELASVHTEIVTLDRRDAPDEQHPLLVTDAEGNEVEDVDAFFDAQGRAGRRMQFTDPSRNRRMTGLYEYVVAVDLTRLFAVARRERDPELEESVRAALEEEGWPSDEERFYLPASERGPLARALAEALVTWQVTSNQARAFNLQTNLVTLVSQDASALANALYADRLSYEGQAGGQRSDWAPVLDARSGASIYAGNEARGLFAPSAGGNGSAGSESSGSALGSTAGVSGSFDGEFLPDPARAAADDLGARLLAYAETLPG